MTSKTRSNVPQVENPATDGRACDLCGAVDFSLLHAWDVGDPWNPATIPIAVWKCACGLVVLHPVPRSDQLPDAGEWWSTRRKRLQRNRWLKLLRLRIRRAVFGGAKRRLVEKTRRVVPSPGRCLDVGCGTGTLLDSAARHWECVGIDPSPVAAAEARGRGFTVIESTFEDADLAPASFDVVFLDSVIEHVRSPAAALAKVRLVLRAGGVVVLKTPKFDGPAYRMHKAGWNGFRHGYHTYLFSGETLARRLRASGFEVLRRPRRDRMFDDVLTLWGRKDA